VDAVKIGMLHSPEIVQAVASAIDRHALPHVVLDPVMVATSGAVLIEQPAVQALISQLFGRVSLVTPNLDEAALLVDRPLATPDDMERAASDLLAACRVEVLLGHAVHSFWPFGRLFIAPRYVPTGQGAQPPARSVPGPVGPQKER
jgi:hydroxymethylpyrimidine/phosphomethylpyrimidine kinase